MNEFSDLPDHSRVWIYTADRELSAAESATIRIRCTAFAAQWQAHKVKVAGEVALLYDRFIAFVADEVAMGVSGCSIDSTVHFVKELGAEYQVNFFDRFYTCLLIDGNVIGATLHDLSTLVSEGKVTGDTLVYDPLISTLGAMRIGWLKPLRESWQWGRIPHLAL